MAVSKRTRAFALGGIAGPLLFATTIVVVGFLRTNYDHTTQFISELGESGSNYSSLMNFLGFMCSAVLIMLFPIALRSRFSSTATTDIAVFLFGLYALGMFLAGVVSCDQTCLPAEASPEQILHNLVSFVAFIALISGVVVWGTYLRKRPDWRGFGTYSFVTAALAVLLLAAMIATAMTRDGAGFFQRGFLAVLYLWMGLFAFRIWSEDARAGS